MDQETRAAWVPLLTSRRLGLALTQQQVADLAGVSLKTVGNLESGDVVPQGKTLTRIIDALQMPHDLTQARRTIEDDLERLRGTDDFGLAIMDWDEVPQDHVDSRMENLSLDDPLDAALARLRDASIELVKAEDAFDSEMHRWAVEFLTEDKVNELRRVTASRIGRDLTVTERRELESQVEAPTVGEIAEFIASSAIHDAREWTRYEMALIEFVYAPPDDVRHGSTYADLQAARERVRQMTVDEDGKAPPAQRVKGRPTPVYRAVGYAEPLETPEDQSDLRAVASGGGTPAEAAEADLVAAAARAEQEDAIEEMETRTKRRQARADES